MAVAIDTYDAENGIHPTNKQVSCTTKKVTKSLCADFTFKLFLDCWGTSGNSWTQHCIRND